MSIASLFYTPQNAGSSENPLGRLLAARVARTQGSGLSGILSQINQLLTPTEGLPSTQPGNPTVLLTPGARTAQQTPAAPPTLGKAPQLPSLPAPGPSSTAAGANQSALSNISSLLNSSGGKLDLSKISGLLDPNAGISGGVLANDGVNGALGLTGTAEGAIDSQLADSTAAALSADQGAIASEALTPFADSAGSVGADAIPLTTPALTDVTAGMQSALDADANAALADASQGLGNSGISSLAGDAGTALGAAGSLYSLYNFAKNWQSGSTGSDAMSGAEAGASTGATVGSIFPGIGTVIGGAAGALIGGAAGALSSAFGGGRADPESELADKLDAISPSGSGVLSPAQSFQYLAGIMDAKNNTPGHSQPIEQVFGREGEGTLLNDIAAQLNSAYAAGKLPTGTSPQQAYSGVIAPWLASKNAAISPTSVDVAGNTEGGNLVGSLQNLIGAYMNGTLTNAVPLGIQGQLDSSLPAYLGAPKVMSPVTSMFAGYLPRTGIW